MRLTVNTIVEIADGDATLARFVAAGDPTPYTEQTLPPVLQAYIASPAPRDQAEDQMRHQLAFHGLVKHPQS
jgi:hypothetical protein